MNLSNDRCHDLRLCLFGCMEGIFDRRSLGFFPTETVRNSSPILWWPTTIRINVVHRSRIAMLIILVMESCSFVWF
jgi:hypothetical protein